MFCVTERLHLPRSAVSAVRSVVEIPDMRWLRLRNTTVEYSVPRWRAALTSSFRSAHSSPPLRRTLAACQPPQSCPSHWILWSRQTRLSACDGSNSGARPAPSAFPGPDGAGVSSSDGNVTPRLDTWSFPADRRLPGMSAQGKGVVKSSPSTHRVPDAESSLVGGGGAELLPGGSEEDGEEELYVPTACYEHYTNCKTSITCPTRAQASEEELTTPLLSKRLEEDVMAQVLELGSPHAVAGRKSNPPASAGGGGDVHPIQVGG